MSEEATSPTPAVTGTLGGAPEKDAHDEPSVEGSGSTESKSTVSKAGRVRNYEYLDHTADVQLHSWGATIEEAFEAQVEAMMDYITDLDTVEIVEGKEVEVSVEGHDLHSLLFNFMDEWLFTFSTDLFVPRKVKITSLDKENWKCTSVGSGDEFVLGVHPQGTEVKAITYSAMQVVESPERTDIWVIVDI